MTGNATLPAKARKRTPWVPELSVATMSHDAIYRYTLQRTWDPGRMVCWVMLNPSTADAAHDDPTVRRCIGYSQDWGYGGLVVVNLWALRSTDPRALATHPDPEGPNNDAAIRSAAHAADLVVCAWGSNVDRVPNAPRRVREVRRLIPDAALCLGRSKAGHPRHPLMVRADVTPKPYGLEDR